MHGQSATDVFLGLGSNLGRCLDSLRFARQQLAADPEMTLRASSPLYQTPALGGPAGQPDYLNAVLQLSTSLPPQQLLLRCQKIETACGRTRNVRWEARTLDIDLLVFGDLCQEEEQLTLPHPRLHTRHFVLLPLVDLAPELIHPRLARSMVQLLKELPPAEEIHKLKEHW